jgi:hypothetical protein
MMNTSLAVEATTLDLLPALLPQIRLVAPASLAAFGRRARTHSKDQIVQIANSIKTFGFSVPVLVDENDKVIAGNARIEAAIQLGLSEIPVVTLSHLDAAQKRAFILAENKLASLAGWDNAVLSLEFKDLLDLEIDFELDVTGFADPEVDALVFGQDEGERASKVALPVTATSRIGDLWLLDRHRVMCGDSTDKEAVSQLLGGEQARTVFQDPPFNVKIGGHVSGTGQHSEFVMASGEMSDDEFTAFLTQVFARTAESLVPGGLAYVCMDFRHMRNVLDAAGANALKLLNLSRLNDKSQGTIIAVQQRLHEDDLAAHLQTMGYEHLNLPAIAEERQVFALSTGRVHVREPGDLLKPRTEPRVILDEFRQAMGGSDFEAQYQQNPTPPDSALIEWSRIQTYEAAPPRERLQYVVQSWDTAFTDGPKADFSVCTTWGFRDGAWLLLDVQRARLRGERWVRRPLFPRNGAGGVRASIAPLPCGR